MGRKNSPDLQDAAVSDHFDESDRILGARIRAVRMGLGKTLEEVARKANVTRSFLSQVERGVASPSLVTLRRIARELHVPIDDRGTDFQQRVWKALREIPVGTTATYGDIAKKIGSPDSVRAVGRACAANPLAVVIPCHRVVRSDGTMAGYRWGLERKRILLQREAHFQLS